jgi:energy-coupling factor transporter transmembrane protein EcfT
MNNITKNYMDIRYMDIMASGDSLLHRLDPRAKLITTLLFIVAVISFDRYTILAFIPFFIYPIVLISAGGLPAGYLLKKILWVSPFAVLVGIFNPVMDRDYLPYRFNRHLRGLDILLFYPNALPSYSIRSPDIDCTYRLQCRLPGIDKAWGAQTICRTTSILLSIYLRSCRRGGAHGNGKIPEVL